MVWVHATTSDKQVPDTKTLGLIHDPRVEQFWDPDRFMSKTMVHELPHDLAWSMADTTGGAPPFIWDIALVYSAHARWGDRFPAPSYFATPVPDSIDGFRAALARTLLGRP